MEFRIIFAGFGGQGIVSMGKLFAHAVMHHGKNVTFYPAYGIAMRGGTANCTVIVSEDEIASPIITTANVLSMMNEQSLDLFLNRLDPGGNVIVNSSLVKKKVSRTDVGAVYVPANEIAENLGDGRMANMAMIGAVLKVTGAAPLSVVQESMSEFFSGKFKNLIEANHKAMQQGYDAAS
jgi:2-oxoglutarate ferredoxin oxidoreductase subunit gamma